MNDAIHRAANRLSGHFVPEDADAFTRAAMTLGVPDDLVDVARRLVDSSLTGAALESSLRRVIEERPGLVSPGYVPPVQPDGLDGGSPARHDPEPVDMNELVRALAGKGPQPIRRAPNGILLSLDGT
jgi:hypothetical protein